MSGNTLFTPLASEYINIGRSYVNKYSIDSYTRAGNYYPNWIHTADRLLVASAILARETRHARNSVRQGAKPPLEALTTWTEVMVAGFAVECLIKAVWLKNGNELIRGGEYVAILRKEGYWLVPLCDRFGIPLSSAERRSLRRLSLIIRGIGRYPILRKAIEADRAGIRWASSDDDVIASLVEGLKRILSDSETIVS